MMFTPRLTKPEKGNKYYITKSQGGYSDAIVGSPTDKDCNTLSNCVGYAVGRFNEIGNLNCCKYLRPVNAELFIKNCGDLQVGKEPKLGACMVWQKGPTLSYTDGAGHVAIVEQINTDGSIVTSESAWNGKAFYTTRRIKGTDNRWGMGKDFTFLGFIYNPAVSDEDDCKVMCEKALLELKQYKAQYDAFYSGYLKLLSQRQALRDSIKKIASECTSILNDTEDI